MSWLREYAILLRIALMTAVEAALFLGPARKPALTARRRGRSIEVRKPLWSARRASAPEPHGRRRAWPGDREGGRADSRVSSRASHPAETPIMA